MGSAYLDNNAINILDEIVNRERAKGINGFSRSDAIRQLSGRYCNPNNTGK